MLRFDDRVAVITGAGSGLGRTYALLLAERGATVVVNDLGSSTAGEGKSSSAADAVVQEIRSKGGKAVADHHSVEEGGKIIETAIKNFGRIDILINNAGILRDRSFGRMYEKEWDIIQQVHLKGAFTTTQAAWPYFQKQEYGRIVFTSSTSGTLGNFGQANYSAAKMGLVGLARTLAIEGAKYGIHSNVILPVAASRLTEGVLPPDICAMLKPEHIAPVTAWLCHEDCPETGSIIQAAGGLVSQYRWQITKGAFLSNPQGAISTIEAVRDNWEKIQDFTDADVPPRSSADSVMEIVNTIGNLKKISLNETSADEGVFNEKVALAHKPARIAFSYTAKDVILYALGLGVSTKDEDNLRFLYEGHDSFAVLPTFAIAPMQNALTQGGFLSWPGLPIDFSKVLHGEQYIEVFGPLPTEETLQSEIRLVEVLDKGSGMLAVYDITTYDNSGHKVCFCQSCVFVVGAGNFGGKRGSDKAIPNVKTPSRKPDAVEKCTTHIDQAVLYRLSGDTNPLHIDPVFAALGGFSQPILHGLCTYGISAKAILKKYADNDVSRIKAVKARFIKPVLPGDTIVVNMWKEGSRIIYTARVEASNTLVIEGYVQLSDDSRSKL